MCRDYPDQAAPHRECERCLEEAGEIFVKGSFVDNRASVLAAKIRRARRERDDFVSGCETDSVGEDAGAFVFENYFLDRLRGAVEAARPFGGGLDEFEGH